MGFRFYIKPWAAEGQYASDFTEVTSDITRSVGSISQSLDNNEFDIGIFRYGNMRLKLRNDHGKYSGPDEPASIFAYKRAGSQVKITWEPQADGLYCGFFFLDPLAYLSEEVTVFEGLLNDKGSDSDIDDQDIDFQVLGFESFLSEVEVPYSSLSNGDTASEIMFAILNQAPITDLLTVSQANIVASVDTAYDDVSIFENKTGLEALKTILEDSNSVLRVDLSRTVYVSDRTESSSDKYNFYGQASELGAENIANIESVRSGENRIINYATWTDTTSLSEDTASIAKYGVQKKDLGNAGVTDATKRNTVLAAIVNEFSQPKREFLLTAPLTPTNAILELLDKVQVDYPLVEHLGQEQTEYAFYGTAQYDVDRYPETLYSLFIDGSERYKILSKRINMDETIELELRRVS